MMLNDIHNSLTKQLEHSDSLQRISGTETDQKRLVLGKVLRFISEQFAEIQIGNTKWQGKLEAPLKAGAHYWFSYEKQPDEQMGRLQVVEAFEKNPKTVQDAAHKLLNGLSLKRTKEAVFLVGALLKEQQPIRENDLKAAIKWLENLPKADAQKGADAVMFAIKRELPVHPGVLDSILAVKDPVPLNRQIARTYEMASREPQHTAGLEKLKNALLPILEAETEVHAEKLIQTLREQIRPAGQEPQTVQPAHTAERGLSQSKTAAEIPASFAGQEAKGVLPKPQSLEAEAVKELLAKLTALAERNGTLPVKEAANWIKSLEARESAAAQTGLEGLTNKEKEVLQNIIKETAPALTNKADALAVLVKMKTLLGVKDELSFLKAIEHGGTLKDQGLQSLKLVLNEIRHSSDLPAPVKQETDQIFHRLNGQLFLQNDQSAQNQLFLSYPLFSKNGVQDLTVFLKGQKKEDGKIDPSQCRLMFYLQLEALDETVVDCLIQQNVMTVTLETGYDVGPLIEPLIPPLKENLKKLGYSLSGVTAKKRENIEITPFMESQFEQVTESALDVKI
ncbi:hypothetical protein [Bacillus swezeyi]|uniref:hypothetical protein n=1 Tax=Bacillus swezeyi TaxID=1925020 RepID=UPI00123C22D6|nr:hypothetical protein [Bacillus swezeyi]KAA6476499.1 hypothetical protein DX928_10625 [Bacillus swezeyi]